MDAKQRAVIDLVLNGQQAQSSLREVTKAVTTLRREINNMREADNPELYRERTKELQKMLGVQQQMRQEIYGSASAWDKVMSRIGTITTGILGAGLVEGVMSQFNAAKTKVMEYKDSLADVSKATDMTTQEAADLNEQLKEIKTRTPTKELREMAVAAGQFGVAKADVDDFVESTDKLNIALGDEFDGAQATAGAVLTMRNIFTDIKSDRIDQDMLHIGNALNGLSAEGAATAPVIQDFSSRIGGTLIPLGLSSAKVLGYAATFQELNVTAERGSTALVNVFQKMLTNTDAFAKVAGVPLNEFKKLIGEDINGAFLKYVEGLKKASGNQLEFANMLAESKLTGAGEMEILSKLVTNTDLLAQRTESAGKLLQETSSITDEASKRNHQLAQDIKTLDESFDSIYQSEAVQNFIGGAVHSVLELIKVLPQASAWLKENSTVTGLFAYALTMLNAGLIKTTLLTWANTTAQLASKAAYEIGFAWLTLQTSATAAYETVMAGATLRVRIATAAQLLWNLALRANPIGLVVTAIAALAFGIKKYSENTESALALERQKVSLQRASKLATELNTRAISDLSEKTKNYNSLSKEEQESIKKTIALKETEARMRLANALAKSREIARSQENKPGFGDGMMQGATNFLTGNWGADLNKQKRQIADQKQGDAYGEAKQLANVEQLKADWEAIRKIKNDLGKPDALPLAPAGDGALTETQGEKKAREKRERLGKKDAKERKDDEKKALDSIAELKSESDADEQKRDIAQAKLKRDRRLAEVDESKATAATKTAWTKQIEDSLLKDLGEIEEKYTEKQAEEEAKRYKQKYDSALAELELKKKTKQAVIAQEEADGYLTKEEADKAKLNAEEKFLEAKKLLNSAHYDSLIDLFQKFTDKKSALEEDKKKSTTDIDAELAENDSKQADAKQAITTATEKHDQDSAKDTYQKKKEIFNDSVSVLKGFFKQNTVIYKAAFVAQQAWALAEVAINLKRAIVAAVASSAGVPFPANLLAIGKAIAIPTLEAASAVANIRAQKFDMPQFAEGGSTAIDASGRPEGFVRKPTIFSLGKRSYLAGEEGEEYILSNPMLQNPDVANLIPALEAIRTGRSYASGGSTAVNQSAMLGAPGSGSFSAEQFSEMMRELRASRQAFEDTSERSVSFDLFAYERKQTEIQQVRIDNSL